MRKHPPKVFSTLTLLIALMLAFSACVADQPSVLVEPGLEDAEIVDDEIVDDTAYIGITDAQAGLLSASALLDYDFQNIDGEVSGEIEEVYVDAATGRIPYVQLEYGGFLEIGDTELLVPLNAFSWGAGGELVLTIDEAILETYPQIDGEWPNFTDPLWDDDIYDYWATAGIDPGINFDETTNTVVPVSNLIGGGISDLGFGAGSISNLLIDLQQGRARYVVLDYGVGLGDELVAVPFSAFAVERLDTGELLIDVNVDRTILEGAPALSAAYLTQTRSMTKAFTDRSTPIGWMKALIQQESL